MRGKEIDTRRRPAVALAEEVGGARNPRGEGACGSGLAAPEAAHLVAVAVVPFQPARGKLAEAVAARSHVPGFRDHDQAGEKRILLDGRKQRCACTEARCRAAHHRREVEAEAVDAGAADPAPHRVHGELHHMRRLERQRVAATRVVDQHAACMAVVKRMVEAAERQCCAVRIALARVVEHDVEDHPDPRPVQRADGGADLGQSARRQARIRRHEAHRIVAPGVRQPERWQVALIDPGGKRHEFNGIDS